jgi:hypothetical protein
VRSLIATTFALSAAVGLARPAAAAEPDALTRWTDQGWTLWRIDNPSQARARTAYPGITLHPGDVVRIAAAGCVGRGPELSARYVDVARISIPGVTDGWVRLADVLDRELSVPESADPAALTVALSTQGARGELGGCNDGFAPYVAVAARAAGSQSLVGPAPMDLVPTSYDTNGMWLNPRWGIQQTVPGSFGDPRACFNLSGWFSNPACTVQRPSIDEPTGLTWLICYAGSTTPIEGHVNWYATSFKGPVYWSSQSWPDMDYNINLDPPSNYALTTANTSTIHTEFDARETIDHFITPWWTAFRGASDATKRTMINGRPAIMAGLVGTDCEHDCYSEIHPVWALAIHVKDDPNDDVWAVFVRNFGNEGFCSRYQHLVLFPNNRYTFSLPWRAGATGVSTTTGTGFYANLSGMSYWWGAVPGQNVSLTVQLLSPYSYPRVHGELHLRWSGPVVRTAEGLAPEPEVRWEEKGGGQAERWLTEIVEGLSTEQRRSVEDALAAQGFVVPRGDRLGISRVSSARPEPETRLSAATPVTAVLDRATTQANEQRVLALRKAYGGPLPGRVGEIIERYLERQKRQAAAGGRSGE